MKIQETSSFMPFTYITKFHTPRVHAEKVGNSQRIIA